MENRINSSQSLAFALKGLTTPLVIFDSEKRLIFYNGAYSTFWKLDSDWLNLGPSLDEVYERLRIGRILPEVANFNSFKENEALKFSTLSSLIVDMMYLPDGRSVRRQIYPNGQGGLVYTFEDMSEQLSLQREVKELGAVQGETLDALHEGIAVFGSDGLLEIFNPTFSSLWEINK